VELLCRCDDIPDDGIELRVLKGLLTAVTSNAVHVHGQALLLVMLTTSGETLRVVQACVFSDAFSTSRDHDPVLHVGRPELSQLSWGSYAQSAGASNLATWSCSPNLA